MVADVSSSIPASVTPSPTPAPPADEVDLTLLAWFAELSLVERLRAASRAAAILDRLAHAADADRAGTGG
jgi:hypothetical protein